MLGFRATCRDSGGCQKKSWAASCLDSEQPPEQQGGCPEEEEGCSELLGLQATTQNTGWLPGGRACATVTIEKPADANIIVIRNHGLRAMLKLDAATGAIPISGHFTPGIITTQIRAAFWKLHPLEIMIPELITNLSQRHLMSTFPPLPCVTDSPLYCEDIAILCNSEGVHSMAMIWWILA
ncbi:40S ribosomal protein SA [Sciurus carolinensis]|uniref:40S ribosomal protein SA n=1 Tax=Sciurus carolinensis TaxID=30640 RepID=A0AA41NJG1_SCICA|nr:40S ribosomal protein SA [Sciurus carolinensis]